MAQVNADKNGIIQDLTQSQWDEFWQNGFVKIGKTLTESELNGLQQRVSDIMLGKIKYDNLLMQVDQSNDKNILSKTEYESNNLEVTGQSLGFKGSHIKYRKIGEAGCGLECDDLFTSFMKKTVFKNICNNVYGKHVPVSIYRSMVFNKPAASDGGGTYLPWHQDGGNWWALDRDPLVFTWTALYDSTIDNGCVQCIPGSHKNGILSHRGHTLNQQLQKEICKPECIVHIPCKAGETMLCHNFTVHRSGINKTEIPRWGFSANYTDGRTKVLNPKPKDSGPIGTPGQSFKVIFPSPFASKL
eukprot:52169_1